MRIYGAVMIGNGKSVRVHTPLISQRKNKVVVLNGYIDGVYVKCGEYCPIYYDDGTPKVSRVPIVVTPPHVRKDRLGKHRRFS